MLHYEKALSTEYRKEVTAREAYELHKKLGSKFSDIHAFRCCGANGTCEFPLTCVNMLHAGKMAPHFRPSSRTAQHASECKHADEEKRSVPQRIHSSGLAQSRNHRNEHVFVLDLSSSLPESRVTDKYLSSKGTRKNTPKNGTAEKGSSSLASSHIDIKGIVDFYCHRSLDEISLDKVIVNGSQKPLESLFCNVSKLSDAGTGSKIYFGLGKMQRNQANDGWRIQFTVPVKLYCVIKDVCIEKARDVDKIKKYFSKLEGTDQIFFMYGWANEYNGTFFINSDGEQRFCHPEHIVSKPSDYVQLGQRYTHHQKIH